MTTAEDRPEIDWDRVEWRKASACGDTACVEVAMVGDVVAVRDGKSAVSLPLVFSRAEWVVFVAGVKAGDFE